MTTNVEVTKLGTENNLTLIRKFTKRVQGSGILSRVRSDRYSKRALSEFVKKKQTLKRIKRKSEVEKLIKLGKPVKKGR